ncbi:MAG: Tim44/TimA family putative adaptor protein [Magnetospiraceae bacterium]
MSEGFQFIDIIIFALIAVFLIMRLRSVLGRRDGTNGNHGDPFQSSNRQAGPPPPPANGSEAPRDEDNVFQFPGGEEEPAPTAPQETFEGPPGVLEVMGADPSFSPQEFVEGAKAAFEMVLVAFAGGDKSVLRNLLSDDVYADFEAAVDDRESRKETMDYTLVRFRDVKITDAELVGSEAQISVQFDTDQVTVVRDSGGEVVDGDANAVASNTDVWTFARDLRSSNPNWTLVSTEADG